MNASIQLSPIDGLALLIYVVSLVVFVRAFIAGREEPTRATIAALWAAFAVHTVALAASSVRAGYIPIIGMSGALSFIAWSVALCFIFLQSHLRSSSLGVFILPFVILFAGIAWFLEGRSQASPELIAQMRQWGGVLLAVHIATALFSYSCFAISFAGGLMYVLLDHEIHDKHLGFFFRRMPSLDKIDKINTHAMGLGLMSLGVGIVSGAVGLVNVAHDGQIVWDDNAKIVTAALIWLAYGANLAMITQGGWRGRRGAIVSIMCFCMVFILYFVVNLLFARLHGTR